jgi:hypothetical protein
VLPFAGAAIVRYLSRGVITDLVPESGIHPWGVGEATYDTRRIFRYSLSRFWDEGRPRVCWIMLNPSTATAAFDDPTIARITAFSRAWGYGSLSVVNLFALRAKTPEALLQARDPIGPHNDEIILKASSAAAFVVAAWGNHGTIVNSATDRPRCQEVQSPLTAAGVELSCLTVTKRGLPGHPLYLPASAKPMPYPQSVLSPPARIS